MMLLGVADSPRWDGLWPALIGGLITGAVTATALYATIRHERHERGLQLLDDRCSRLIAASISLHSLLSRRRTSNERLSVVAGLQAVTTAAGEIIARARRLDAAFAQVVTSLVVNVREAFAATEDLGTWEDQEAPAPADVLRSVQALMDAPLRWLAQPSDFTAGVVTADDLIAGATPASDAQRAGRQPDRETQGQPPRQGERNKPGDGR